MSCIPSATTNAGHLLPNSGMIPYKNLRYVDTFHGREYYLTVVVPTGCTSDVQISEQDYTTLANRQRDENLHKQAEQNFEKIARKNAGLKGVRS